MKKGFHEIVITKAKKGSKTASVNSNITGEFIMGNKEASKVARILKYEGFSAKKVQVKEMI